MVTYWKAAIARLIGKSSWALMIPILAVQYSAIAAGPVAAGCVPHRIVYTPNPGYVISCAGEGSDALYSVQEVQGAYNGGLVPMLDEDGNPVGLKKYKSSEVAHLDPVPGVSYGAVTKGSKGQYNNGWFRYPGVDLVMGSDQWTEARVLGFYPNRKVLIQYYNDQNFRFWRQFCEPGSITDDCEDSYFIGHPPGDATKAVWPDAISLDNDSQPNVKATEKRGNKLEKTSSISDQASPGGTSPKSGVQPVSETR